MVNKQQFSDTYQYFDKAVVIEIIDIFITEYEGRFEKLEEDIKTRNYKDLKFDAHAIKGVIANFYAPEAWEKARSMENTGKTLLESDGEQFDEADLLNRLSDLKQCVVTIAGELASIKEDLLKS